MVQPEKPERQYGGALYAELYHINYVSILINTGKVMYKKLNTHREKQHTYKREILIMVWKIHRKCLSDISK